MENLMANTIISVSQETCQANQIQETCNDC